MTTLSEKSVILLEFNELCPTLMERFMEEGKLPNFQRFYRESEIYTPRMQKNNLLSWNPGFSGSRYIRVNHTANTKFSTWMMAISSNIPAFGIAYRMRPTGSGSVAV